MRLKKHQTGLTFITWLFIMLIAGFFALLTLKLVPIYIENMGVKSVIESMHEDSKVANSSIAGIRTIIKKRLSINQIYDFPQEYIKITKGKNRLIVDITYDKVEPIIGNVSVLVSFSEKLDIEL